MGEAGDRWDRRPPRLVVTGPGGSPLEAIRSALAAHPGVAVADAPSRFWDACYGVHPDARPAHWPQAWAGLSGKARVEVDPGFMALPSSRVGVVAAAYPSLRYLLVVRDPEEASWEAVRRRFGDGDPGITALLAEIRSSGEALLAASDYDGALGRLAHHADRRRVHVAFARDLDRDPDGFLADLATLAGVRPDLFPAGCLAARPIESPLPDEPPAPVASLLAAMHRRQVEAIEARLGEPLPGRREP